MGPSLQENLYKKVVKVNCICTMNVSFGRCIIAFMLVFPSKAANTSCYDATIEFVPLCSNSSMAKSLLVLTLLYIGSKLVQFSSLLLLQAQEDSSYYITASTGSQATAPPPLFRMATSVVCPSGYQYHLILL